MGTETRGATQRRSGGETADPTAEGDRGPGRDQTFHVLRNRRRRFAIHHLKRVESADVGELATRIAAWENGVPIDEVTAQQRRRVYNALQQTHLAELLDAGLVDVERREVSLTDRAARLDAYLEERPRRATDWWKYALAFGVLVLGAHAVTLLGLLPVSVVDDGTIVTLLGVALLASAVANYAGRLRRGRDDERPPELWSE